MATSGYFVCILTSIDNRDVLPYMVRATGSVHFIMSYGVGYRAFSLMVVPDNEKTAQGIDAALQQLPAGMEAWTVDITDPPEGRQLAALRELFERLEWDTSELTDEELIPFICTKLAGKYVYTIDLQPQLWDWGPELVRIRPTQDVFPDVAVTDESFFTTEWPDDDELTVEHEETFLSVGYSEDEPAPDIKMPALPARFARMTDDELSQLVRRKMLGPLEGAGIEITRAPGLLSIKVSTDEFSSCRHFRLPEGSSSETRSGSHQ